MTQGAPVLAPAADASGAGAIDEIQNRIRAGTWLPGQRLPSERALAESLGVSRPTVREAVRALATLGVLQTRRGSGTYVTDLSADMLSAPFDALLSSTPMVLDDLLAVRRLLEVQAARWACVHINGDELATLEELLARLVSSTEDVPAFIDADVEFHKVIHRASRNGVLQVLMDMVSALARSSRRITADSRTLRERTVLQHRRILAALRDRDADRAADAMEAHLAHVQPHLRPSNVAEPC